MKNWYVRAFSLTANERYHNPRKQFSSYFLTFPSGPRLELMHRPDIAEAMASVETTGWAHIALSVGAKEEVDRFTEHFRAEGITIAGEPRTTGDGYYESVIRDPEGNLIELTV